MTAYRLLVASLATYRLTRLFTADKITERIREALIARSDFFGYLITCDWCLSIWIAPALASIVMTTDTTIIDIAVHALALSAATGLIATVEKRLDT